MPQPNEVSAIEAMIAVSPGPFWALMQSLIESGYLPTENILVLRSAEGRGNLVVKEGNRRIAVLKLIHGHIERDSFDIPDYLITMIDNLPRGWKTANSVVPCTIYEPSEVKIVERIRALTHGKGEQAGRDEWKPVARARHNRDENGASEPGLDLLEKYLRTGKNLSEQQRQRWAGGYFLSVLDETLKRLAPRFGAASAREVANLYPKIPHKNALDDILLNIGLENIGFKNVRGTGDFAANYGLPPLPQPPATGGSNPAQGGTGDHGKAAPPNPTGGTGASSVTGGAGSPTKTPGATPTPEATAPTGSRKIAAVAIDDPKEVIRVLKKFKPKGDRSKVAALVAEAKCLKLEKNPIAFCFLLRSMFEISAKLYCEEHKGNPGAPKSKSASGDERRLVEILRDIYTYMTTLPNNKKDRDMVKALHGAMVELGKEDGVLSVTSMNQLVHNPRFHISPKDISSVFSNVFPLLAAMNQ